MDVSLAALAALALTTALVERITVAVGIEPGVVVTLLCPAASVYTTVDVEVEVKVT